MTSGGAPATVVYAVDPASGGLAFHETQTGANASNVQLIVNPSGDYSCTQSGSGAWSCQKLGSADAAAQQQIFDLYTPSHWISFLKGDLVGGRTGGGQGHHVDTVAQRFRHELRGSRRAGRDRDQHHLQHRTGHLGLCQGGRELHQLRHHELLDLARAASLFQLPPGATVTTATTPTT